MTREEAIKELNTFRIGAKSELGTNALDVAIKALSQEPCEDVISREWLKTAIHNFYYGLKHIPTEEDIQAYIDIAPPVTPKAKTDILDKIKAEIEMYEADCRLQGGTDECEKCNSNVFGSVYRIIDKYKTESEEL